MNFGNQLVKSSHLRRADFNTLESNGQLYEFTCSKCSKGISFLFTSIIGKEFSWRDDFNESTVQKISKYFEMNIVGKSPDGGWTAIMQISCDNCSAPFLVYGGVHETSNSVYKVTIQSIVEIYEK